MARDHAPRVLVASAGASYHLASDHTVQLPAKLTVGRGGYGEPRLCAILFSPRSARHMHAGAPWSRRMRLRIRTATRAAAEPASPDRDPLRHGPGDPRGLR